MKKTNFAKLFAVAFLCSFVFATTSRADTGPVQLSGECADAALLSQADLATIDALVALDSLSESSDVALLGTDNGTCSAPKVTGACLTCADKGTCKDCCTTGWGVDSPTPNDKARAACQKGCDKKFNGGGGGSPKCAVGRGIAAND